MHHLRKIFILLLMFYTPLQGKENLEYGTSYSITHIKEEKVPFLRHTEGCRSVGLACNRMPHHQIWYGIYYHRYLNASLALRLSGGISLVKFNDKKHMRWVIAPSFLYTLCAINADHYISLFLGPVVEYGPYQAIIFGLPNRNGWDIRVTLGAHYTFYFNPFLIKPEEGGLFKPDINKVTFLVQLVGKIWKGDLNTNPMSEVEKALLAGWIPEYYATLHKESVPSLTGFYDYLKKLVDQKDKQVKKLTDEGLFPFHEFFIVLHPFAHGIYKEHFNSYEQVYLEDHKLICFELEAIKNNPKLYPLVVQVLFKFAFEMVAQYPDVTKFIDIEEGWTMLDDYAEENIEAFFRKGRKTKTSIRIITQNIDEIKASKLAGAMKNNASTFILFYNEKKSSREDIGTFIGMTPFEMEKYESLRRKNGSDGYREVFIKEMGEANIWLLHTSLWEHALLTSRPDERNAITRLIQEKGDAQLGIAEWVDGQRKLQAK